MRRARELRALKKKGVGMKEIPDGDQALTFYLLGQLSFHVSWCWVNFFVTAANYPKLYKRSG